MRPKAPEKQAVLTPILRRALEGMSESREEEGCGFLCRVRTRLVPF